LAVVAAQLSRLVLGDFYSPRDEPGQGNMPENDTSKIVQPERRNPTTGNETPKQ